MDKINFTYTYSEEILNDGLRLSGLFSPARPRQIILSALMAIVVANAIYSTVSLKELTFRNVFYFVAAVALILLIWVEPKLREVRHKKELLGKTAEIELAYGKITAVIAGERLNIIGDGLKGYREEEKYFVIYFASEYALLPKTDKTPEEIKIIQEILDNFYTVKEEQ